MTVKSGRITITRRSNQKGHGKVAIQIGDQASRTSIVELEMSYTDFAECIMGMSEMECEITRTPGEKDVKRFGKIKETQRVICEKTSRADQSAKVHGHFAEIKKKDPTWELWNDGVGTQQPHDSHVYVICRWVDQKSD